MNPASYFKIFVLLILAQQGMAQDLSDSVQPKSRYYISGGSLFTEPELLRNNYPIGKRYSYDAYISVAWLRRVEEKFGAFFKVDFSSQTYRYDYSSYGGGQGQRTKSSGNGKFSFTTALSYDLFNYRGFNLFVYLGPQVHWNLMSSYDYSWDPMFYREHATTELRRFGFGYNCGLNVSYKLFDRWGVFIGTGYQKGFVPFREVQISNFNGSSVLVFNGTAWVLGAGLRIFPKSSQTP